MHNLLHKQKLIPLVIVLALFFGLTSSSADTASAQGKKLKVITTTTILQDITVNITGDKADVQSLIPTNGDVHQFEPKPEDVRKIATADLVIVNGVGLETFMDKLISDSGTKAKIITASQGLSIQKFQTIDERAASDGLSFKIIGVSGSYKCAVPQSGQDIGDCDPHLWQNVTNVIGYVFNIRAALSAADPTNADTYNMNAGSYISKLQKLDADIFNAVAQIPAENRTLVTNHDALGYFAARYGFQIAGVVLPSGTVQEPSPKDIAALITTVRAKKVKAVFVENVTSDKLAQQIAQGAGVKVYADTLFTDALGDKGSTGETYLGMMASNIKVLQAALK